ncbi:MAG: hypothetical protein M3Z96_14345 [Pseudomonadota bacterium]|nr:hypothetical protein [Pseudomonadota bacterium]
MDFIAGTALVAIAAGLLAGAAVIAIVAHAHAAENVRPSQSPTAIASPLPPEGNSSFVGTPEAFQKAENCSAEKAVKYSKLAEPAETVAEAAFYACESLWKAALPGYGAFPFTAQQLKANSYLLSEWLKSAEAVPALREAEIKRFLVIVIETRLAKSP